MQEIQFIAPVALHDEMLRLRNENRWTSSRVSPAWTGEQQMRKILRKTSWVRRSLSSGIYCHRRTDSSKNSYNQP